MKTKLLFAVLLLSGAGFAQFTTVSGTVTDPNGLPYANGTIASTLVTSNTPKFTATGQPYLPPSQASGLDLTGTFRVTLADNTTITPGGTTWTFIVCSAGGSVFPAFGKGPQCFTVTGVTISGASQNIGATLSAAAPALTVAFGGGGGLSCGTLTHFSIPFINNSGACITSLSLQFTQSPDSTLPTIYVGSTGTATSGIPYSVEGTNILAGKFPNLMEFTSNVGCDGAGNTLTTTPLLFCSWVLPDVSRAWGFQCDGSYTTGSGASTALVLSLFLQQTGATFTALSTISSVGAGAGNQSAQSFQTSGGTGTTTIATGPTIAAGVSNAPFSIHGIIGGPALGGSFQLNAALSLADSGSSLSWVYCTMF